MEYKKVKKGDHEAMLNSITNLIPWNSIWNPYTFPGAQTIVMLVILAMVVTVSFTALFLEGRQRQEFSKRIASLLAVHNLLSHAAGQKGDSRTEDQYGIVLDCQVCVGTALKDTLVLYTGEYCPFYPAGVPSANEWKGL